MLHSLILLCEENVRINSTHFSLEKALEKQVKTIEDQQKELIKAIEDHGKQYLMKFLKSILILTMIVQHLKNKSN